MQVPASYQECDLTYSWRTAQHAPAALSRASVQHRDLDPGALLDHDVVAPRPPHPLTHALPTPPFHHVHHYPHDRLPPPMYAVPMAMPWETARGGPHVPPPPQPPRTPAPRPAAPTLTQARRAEPFVPARTTTRRSVDDARDRTRSRSNPPAMSVRPDTSSSSDDDDDDEGRQSRVASGATKERDRFESPGWPPPPPPLRPYPTPSNGHDRAEIVVEVDSRAVFRRPTAPNPFKAAAKAKAAAAARRAAEAKAGGGEVFKPEGTSGSRGWWPSLDGSPLEAALDAVGAGTIAEKENDGGAFARRRASTRESEEFGFHDYYSEVLRAPYVPTPPRSELVEPVGAWDVPGSNPSTDSLDERPAMYPHGFVPSRKPKERAKPKRKPKKPPARSTAEYQPALNWKPQGLTARTNATRGAVGGGAWHASSHDPSLPRCTLCGINLTGECLRAQHDAGARHRENVANILETQMRRDCRHADVAPEWRVVEAKARIERSVTNMTRQGKNPWVAQKMGFFDGQGWSK